MAAFSTCPTVVYRGECPYWCSCGNWQGVTCPANAGTTETIFYISREYAEEEKHRELFKESLAAMKARLSREAVKYWGRLNRSSQPPPEPPPPAPRSRNRCCSGSSRYMTR
jgi:hypothetical protein